MNDTKILEDTLHDLEDKGRFDQEKSCFQHGATSVFDHSVHVASASLAFVETFHLTVNTSELVRGALLHDYFLYDWHEKENRPQKRHGFTHSATALENAKNDFTLTAREEDIIVKHMFPLTPLPPKYKESWVVCIADKGCAAEEFLSYRFKGGRESMRLYRTLKKHFRH